MLRNPNIATRHIENGKRPNGPSSPPNTITANRLQKMHTHTFTIILSLSWVYLFFASKTRKTIYRNLTRSNIFYYFHSFVTHFSLLLLCLCACRCLFRTFSIPKKIFIYINIANEIPSVTFSLCCYSLGSFAALSLLIAQQCSGFYQSICVFHSHFMGKRKTFTGLDFLVIPLLLFSSHYYYGGGVVGFFSSSTFEFVHLPNGNNSHTH